MLGFAACRGLDNDVDYEIRTQASFFLTEPVNGTGRSVVRLQDSLLIPDWNAAQGISNTHLSDLAGRESTIWLSSGEEQRILEIDLANGETEEYSNLGMRPHFISPGLRYMMMCDTLDGKLGFLRYRTGEVQEVPVAGAPSRVVYNNEKFYLQLDTGSIAIYNERALTPVKQIDLGNHIFDIQLDKFRNCRVESSDGTQNYLSIIEANGDFLLSENGGNANRKTRNTPYLTSRFETEYLNDVNLNGFDLNIIEISDSVDNFEVDFFEGRLFYSWQDSLTRYDLHSRSFIDRLPFPFQMIRSWHYAGGILLN